MFIALLGFFELYLVASIKQKKYKPKELKEPVSASP
jgi:hypothetical protein